MTKHFKCSDRLPLSYLDFCNASIDIIRPLPHAEHRGGAALASAICHLHHRLPLELSFNLAIQTFHSATQLLIAKHQVNHLAAQTLGYFLTTTNQVSRPDFQLGDRESIPLHIPTPQEVLHQTKRVKPAERIRR